VSSLLERLSPEKHQFGMIDDRSWSIALETPLSENVVKTWTPIGMKTWTPIIGENVEENVDTHHLLFVKRENVEGGRKRGHPSFVIRGFFK
jgi:hypothetical protein